MYLRALFATLVAATTAHGDEGSNLDAPNANHIFNTIHDSMRQWGSSLNHNGMSVFLASVPKDTELYHGTHTPWRINGTEWLAFEPEHALMFARGPMTRPPKDPKDPDEDDHEWSSMALRRDGGLQMVLEDGDEKMPRPRPPMRPAGPGYFHTYRTKQALRLLYVNGQSAAKSSKGTLDMQDYVLLAEPPSNAPGEWLPFDDVARAKALCRTAQTEWEDRIDGVIRMEAGFEIILCDFKKDLEVVKISEAKNMTDRGEFEARDETFNYYKAVEARYDGIGGDRVTLDQEDFITLFDYPEAMYLDHHGLPRVNNASTAISSIRGKINQLTTKEVDPISTDWQTITDMVVARYADKIEYLLFGAISNLTGFQNEVDRALRPFISYDLRNSTAEIERCIYQFLPSTPQPSSLAYRSILDVTSTICSTLSSLLSEDLDLLQAVEQTQRLKSWLQWSTWKRCRGCGHHEVCFLPIWPIGSKEDFERPRCRSDIFAARGDYWNDFGPQ